MTYDPPLVDESRRDISDRSRAASLALCALLGVFGAHRFYVGKAGTGVLMLCTLGGCGVWVLYDVILISAGGFRDRDGRKVVNWFEGEASERTAELTNRRQELISEELDGLRADYNELAERVDFMERMIAKVKDRAIPPSG